MTEPAKMNAYAAVPTIYEGVTRAQFYARRYGGGVRTARKQFVCMQFGCFCAILPKAQYFDTLEPTTWPRTKRICLKCSQETPS